MNVPKLRFKEFNDKYNITKVSEIIDVIDGDRGNNYPKANDFYDSEFCLFLNAGNVTKNGFNFKNNQFITKEKDKKLRKGKLLINDIVLTTRGTVGNVAWFNEKTPYKNIRINSGMVINRIKENGHLLPEYLYSYMKSPVFEIQVNKMNYGSAQPQLTVSGINKFNIQYPTINEQKKVSTIMLLLDKKIELQSKKIEDLKLFKKGLLKKNYYKIANNNLTELSCIANIYQPQTISQSELDNGKYYVFGANGIIGKYSKFNHKFMQVTISCRGENSGTINLTPDECWITGNSMVLNVDENKNVDKLYLKNILEAQNLKYLISGSGQPQIVRSSVLKHKIPYISIEQQKKFTIPFIKLDSKIKLEQNKLIKLQKLKKGLMQRMFV